MNTIDHGKWVAYKPATLPPDAPENTMFTRRESDGVDWYEYVRPGSNFQPGNVIIAAMYRAASDQYVVGPATREQTDLFPVNCIVHEVTDYVGSNPQADLGSKAFDPATGIFSDPIIPVEPGSFAALLQDMDARIKALETKLGGA